MRDLKSLPVMGCAFDSRQGHENELVGIRQDEEAVLKTVGRASGFRVRVSILPL